MFSVLGLGYLKNYAHLLCQILLVGLWKLTVSIYFSQIWIKTYIIIKWLVVRLNIITKLKLCENFINLFGTSFEFFLRWQYASLKNCQLFNYSPSVLCISSLYFMICFRILKLFRFVLSYCKRTFLFLIMHFEFLSFIYQKLIV